MRRDGRWKRWEDTGDRKIWEIGRFALLAGDVEI